MNWHRSILCLTLVVALFGVSDQSLAEGFLIDTIPIKPKINDPDRVINISPVVEDGKNTDKGSGSVPQSWQAIATHKDWIVQCRSEIRDSKPTSSCRMLAQEVIESQERKNNGKLAEFTIETIAHKGSTQSIGLINTPGALLLPIGMTTQVDQGKKNKLVVRSCHFDQTLLNIANPVRCLAPFQLNASLLASFRAGQNIKLSWQDLSGKPQSQIISLLGFTAAYRAFTK